MLRTVLTSILAVAFMLIGYILWKIFHSSGEKKRGESKGLGDRKKIFAQAKYLWDQGLVQEAANVLESGQYHTEAASVLEKGGLTRDAGLLLLRTGHNRLGASILEKHQHWTEAAHAYKELRNYQKEGLCSFNAGLYSDAAFAYSTADAHLEAGECYMLSGQFSQAASSFMIAGEETHWVEAIKQSAEKTPDMHQFSRTEFSWIVKLSSAFGNHQPLFSMLDKQDLLTPFLLNRLEQGDFEGSSEIFANFKNRMSEVISRIDYESQAAEVFAKVLLWAGEYESAGVLFQHRSEFSKAAQAFKQSGNEKRATECLERLKGQNNAEGTGFQLTTHQPAIENSEESSFTLPSETPSADNPDEFADSPETDHTLIVHPPEKSATDELDDDLDKTKTTAYNKGGLDEFDAPQPSSINLKLTDD